MTTNKLVVPTKLPGLYLTIYVSGLGLRVCLVAADPVNQMLVYAQAPREKVYLDNLTRDWCLWIGGAAFEIDPKDAATISAELGIPMPRKSEEKLATQVSNLVGKVSA